MKGRFLVDGPQMSQDLVPGVEATLADPLSFVVVPRNGRKERSQMANGSNMIFVVRKLGAR